MSVYDKYEIVVGLEVHAQLNTKSKIFAPDSAAFGAAPNEHTSFITLGHPGTLPVINKKVVESAVKMGLATNCHIQQRNEFARKNYFYADLPKGYQISQYTTPICYKGFLDIKTNGVEKRIGITQIHLEEDAGKSTHDQDPYYSLIDLNRAGVPLIEIVSEPDLRSSDEAYEYLSIIRKLVQYLDVCDGNMEEGSMRCDANVSVRLKGASEYGQRTEVKNMNSLRNVKRAIEYEAKRQVDVIEAGGRIEMQTRSFDAVKGTTFTLRSKEMAHDYRYFPEPDLPPVVLTDSYIETVKSGMPALPNELFAEYTEQLGLSEYDATVLTDEKHIALYFKELVKHTTNYKAAANWMTGPVKSYLNKQALQIGEFPIAPTNLAKLVDLVDNGQLSFSGAAQQLFPAWIAQPKKAPLVLAQEMNLIMSSDDSVIEQLIDEVMEKFPKKVKAYQKGKKGLAGFFMGQIMRNAKEKLDPKLTNKLLIGKLNKYGQ